MSNTSISKPFADSLRNYCLASVSIKIKASHAHEIIAAFFGHKSNISLLNDNAHPLCALEDANFLIPDVDLMDERRKQLNGFPEGIPPANILAKVISDFIQKERYFTGEVWLADKLETYIVETFLPSLEETISDELADLMPPTNTIFYDAPNYDTKPVSIIFSDDSVKIFASGTFTGKHLKSKILTGNQIDFNVHVTVPRVAGKRCFGNLDIAINGEIKYRDQSNQKTKRSRFANPLTAIEASVAKISNSFARVTNPISAFERQIESVTSIADSATKGMFEKAQLQNKFVGNILDNVTSGILEASQRHTNLVKSTIGSTITKVFEEQQKQAKLVEIAIGSTPVGAFDAYQRQIESAAEIISGANVGIFEEFQHQNKLVNNSIDSVTTQMLNNYQNQTKSLASTIYGAAAEKIEEYRSQLDVVENNMRGITAIIRGNEELFNHLQTIKNVVPSFLNHDSLFGESEKLIKKLTADNDDLFSNYKLAQDAGIGAQLASLPVGFGDISSLKKLTDDFYAALPTDQLMQNFKSISPWHELLDGRSELQRALDESSTRTIFDFPDDIGKTEK